MSETKARLIGAITVMDESAAQRLWSIVESLYGADPWAVIPKETPDEVDLQMIRSAQADPDCHSFASPDEVRALLN